ncbi:MAG: hypothetical protein AAF902_15900, partial [Chloroflexota bacterium]
MNKVYAFCLLVGFCTLFVTGCSGGTPLTGQILYLQTDSNEAYQLFQIDPKTDDAVGRQITFFEQNILDFAIAQDHQIALTLEADDGSHDIWAITGNDDEPIKLIDCQDSVCGNPVWAPQGDLFIFERRPMENGVVDEDKPSLWWFDLNARQAIPVFAGDDWYGQEVRFAADGSAISYFVQVTDE